jgi:flagellar hook assembly protein FlgD
MIQLSLPRQDAVLLQIFDLSGRLIKTLVDSETKPAGTYDFPWDGRDAGGRAVSAGSYLYKAKVGSVVESGRMTLLK